MIRCKELNKDFDTIEEMFLELKKQKDILISAKKSEIYKSIEKSEGLSVISNQSKIKKIADTTKAIDIDDNYYYFVVNSSRILDSHNDLHVDGNWEKSVKEQQGRCYLVFDHELKREEIIVMKQDVEMLTATIPFSAINKDYNGNTYVLIYKVAKDKIVNQQAKEWLDKGYDFECSVRMQYMDIQLAMNSQRPEDAKELETYDRYIDEIANKDEFEDITHFWVIKQAKNVLESSLVMFGSNSATGTIRNTTEPQKHSESIEPSEDTQKLNQFFNTLKLN